MKKLSVLCAMVMLCSAVPALAQPAYRFALAGTKNFISAKTISSGTTISLDLYLTAVGAPQNAGGAWIDFSGSISGISYVSGGRCLASGAEGCTGPWQNNAGVFINEPDDPATGIPMPGKILYIVANLSGAAPDGDGDLIVGTVTLMCTAERSSAVDLVVVPGVATWAPLGDASIEPATLTLSPSSPTSTTTSIPGETTTSSGNSTSSSTSSSIPQKPCLVKQLYGEHSREAELCRSVRDNVLRETPEGRELIKTYYAWSPRLVSVLEQDGALKDQVKKLLDQILLLIGIAKG